MRWSWATRAMSRCPQAGRLRRRARSPARRLRDRRGRCHQGLHSQTLLELRSDAPSVLALAGSQAQTIGSLTIDLWPWGQFNRLLPLKVTCRALLRIQTDDDGTRVELQEATKDIARAGQELADHLRAIDDASQHERDELLATGFPAESSAPNSEKSLRRFRDQFVGSIDSLGALHGLPGAWVSSASTAIGSDSRRRRSIRSTRESGDRRHAGSLNGKAVGEREVLPHAPPDGAGAGRGPARSRP